MRRFDDLNQLIENAPSVPLKVPVQRGFVRSYVLSAEGERRADAQVVRDILKQIGTLRYFWRRSFRRGRRAGRNIEIEQPLLMVLIDTWIQNPKLYPQAWAHYFHLEIHGQFYYVFSAMHLITLKVSPHVLTHTKMVDPRWYEEQAELNAWLNRRMGREKYYRMVGIGNERGWDSSGRSRALEKDVRRRFHKMKLNPEEAEMRRLQAGSFQLLLLVGV
jgi:hypothetical protein